MSLFRICICIPLLVGALAAEVRYPSPESHVLAILCAVAALVVVGPCRRRP